MVADLLLPVGLAQRRSSFFFNSPSQDARYVINMGNSIIGVSILAMPWCFAKVGVLLGTILLILGGVLTKISCTLLLDAATLNGRVGYEYLALLTSGKWMKLTVEMTTIGYLLGVCVAFLVTMGDLLPPVAARLLSLPESSGLRAWLLLIVTICIALPLSLIEKIERLSSLSALCMAFYALLALKVLVDAVALSQAESSLWDVSMWRAQNFLAVFPIFATGLSCQTQVFVMYESLAEPSPQRMKAIISDAINICIFLYWSVGYFGYVAFSESGVKGNILLNLGESLFSDVVKILYTLTAAISFPLCIFPCRRSVETLLCRHDGSLEKVKTENGTSPSRMISILMVLCTLMASLVIPDIESILNLSGGTMGAVICFIIPAIIVFRTEKLTGRSRNILRTTMSWVILFVGLSMLLACLYQVSFLPLVQPWLWPFSATNSHPSKDITGPEGAT